MTTDDIRALLESATKGPWTLETQDIYYDISDVEYAKKKGIIKDVGDVMSVNIVGMSVFHVDHDHWLGDYINGNEDDFNLAVKAPDLAAIALAQAEEIKRLRELLQLWDDLIDHQYSGSREAMSDMTYIAQATAAALKEPKP